MFFISFHLHGKNDDVSRSIAAWHAMDVPYNRNLKTADTDQRNCDFHTQLSIVTSYKSTSLYLKLISSYFKLLNLT